MRAGDMRVFRSSSRVFFKIVRVCRQLHENFVSHTRTCDIAKHACIRMCMHARSRKEIRSPRVANSVQYASAQDDNPNVNVRQTYVHSLKIAHS